MKEKKSAYKQTRYIYIRDILIKRGRERVGDLLGTSMRIIPIAPRLGGHKKEICRQSTLPSPERTKPTTKRRKEYHRLKLKEVIDDM